MLVRGGTKRDGVVGLVPEVVAEAGGDDVDSEVLVRDGRGGFATTGEEAADTGVTADSLFCGTGGGARAMPLAVPWVALLALFAPTPPDSFIIDARRATGLAGSADIFLAGGPGGLMPGLESFLCGSAGGLALADGFL